MKRKKSRRILALLLSLLMLVSLLPLQAFSEAELTEQMETNMEQTMETDVSDETAESDILDADDADEQADENLDAETGDGGDVLTEESIPDDSDEPESEEPDEPAEETVDESDQQEEQDTQPVDDPLLQEPTGDVIEESAEVPSEEPADENAEQETLPETEPTEELPVDEEAEADVQQTIADCIAAYGHVYATTLDTAMVYADSAMLDEQQIFTVSQAGALLLATAYVPEMDAVKVWFMALDGEILTGYVRADMLSQIPVTDEQADEMANILWFDYADSEAGTLLVFVVAGEKPVMQEEQPTEEPVMDDSLPAEPNEEAEVPETEAHAAIQCH